MDNNQQYDNSQINNMPYGNSQINNSPYGNPQMNSAPYGNPQMNNAPYGNPQMNNAPYGNPQMNNMPYGGMQMGTPQYGNSPKKSGPGMLILCICIGVALIAGIVVAIVVHSKNNDDDSNQNTENTVESSDTTGDIDTTDVAEATDGANTTEDVEVTEDADTTDDEEDTDHSDAEDSSGDTNDDGDYEEEGYIEVLDAYFECYSNRDMTGMASFYPEDIGTQVWDSTIETMGVGSEEGYWQLMEMAYGEDFTITYEIIDTTMLQRVEYIMYESNVNATYDVDLKFEDAIKLTINEICAGSLSSYTATESLLMAVIDGEWYVIGSIYY